MVKFQIVAVAALAAVASPAAAVELIVNGGFETGSFAGWTQFGAVGSTAVTALAANTGSFGASFSPNAVGGLLQTFATVAGTSYTISFDLAHTTAAPIPLNAFDASFGGTSLLAYSNVGLLPYTSFSFTQVATGVLTQLQFSFRDTRATVFRLDNVSVEDVPVASIPEPATWALMIGGFGLVGATLRRRRMVAAA